MAVGIIKGSAGGVPLSTLAVAGVLKPVLEGVIAGTPVGNGTLVSGAAKIGGAFVMGNVLGGSGLGKDIGNGVQIALAVDGIEDIIRGVSGGFGGLGGGGASADAW